MPRGQLPWLPNQEADLLKLVIAKEAHLLKEGTIENTKVWSEIDSELWEQEFMKNYNDNRAKSIARTNPQ